MATINNISDFTDANTITDFYEVPLVKATSTSLHGYGKIVDDFKSAEVDIVPWPLPGWRKLVPGTGIEGGITEDTFEFEWKDNYLFSTNNAVERSYITGVLNLPRMPLQHGREFVYVREANYHPDGGQIFYPHHHAPFIALLALPGDDVNPSDFTAFYCDGSFGIHIDANVWHQPVFPLADKATFDDRQGKVHGCVAVDFLNEFNCWLKVPLKKI